MSTQVPALLAQFVDDAAVFPPGNAALPDAVAAHRRHRAAWYAPMVGPLLVPATAVDELASLVGPGESVEVGLVGALDDVRARRDVTGAVTVRQVEVPVARRGEDPLPGLSDLLTLVDGWPGIRAYAEIPLTWGLMAALDRVAEARTAGVAIAAKFRTGGLAAELFPSPRELAYVICACRDRGLPFKLTAGLHHAVRHTDPETGFTHHGFLNVLTATLAAAGGAAPVDVEAVLASTDPVTLAEPLRARLTGERPLWVGFGSCSIPEPLADLVAHGLVTPPEGAPA